MCASYFDARLAVQHNFPKTTDLVNVSQILQLSTDLVTQHVEVYLASFLWAESLGPQDVELWGVSHIEGMNWFAVRCVFFTVFKIPTLKILFSGLASEGRGINRIPSWLEIWGLRFPVYVVCTVGWFRTPPGQCILSTTFDGDQESWKQHSERYTDILLSRF